MAYTVNEQVTLKATFREKGILASQVEPILFSIKRRAQAAVVEGPFVALQAETGIYTTYFTPAVAGTYDLKVTTADGVVEEGSFRVRQQRV